MRMLDEIIERAKRGFYKLVILVGPSGCGKTFTMLRLSNHEGYCYVNLSLEISRALLDVPANERSFQAVESINNFLSQPKDVFLLDNIEILFAPSLELDPIRLFHSMSRQKILIVSWNGTFDSKTLTYGKPSHPEYRTYRTQEIQAEIYLLDKR